MWVFKTTTYC